MNALHTLAKHTRLVADSSRLEDLQKFAGSLFGITTNPTLVMQAMESSDLYTPLVAEAKARASQSAGTLEVSDCLLALIGTKIYKTIGAQVSLEVDARIASDVEATEARARTLAALCKEYAIPDDKLLIKIAATPEGLEVVKRLEASGIHCNVTLVFSMHQAVAAAEAQAWLISPFVGRVSDWYAKHQPEKASDGCPGVALVRRIQGYMRQFGHQTRVMGASFRTCDQVLQLCGTDLLTISPALLEQLSQLDASPTPYTINETFERILVEPGSVDRALAADSMAGSLLKDGIARFVADQVRLNTLLE